jgi:hypothetical protein
MAHPATGRDVRAYGRGAKDDDRGEGQRGTQEQAPDRGTRGDRACHRVSEASVCDCRLARKNRGLPDPD